MKKIFFLLLTVMTSIASFSCFAQEIGNTSISFQLPHGFKQIPTTEYSTLIRKHISDPMKHSDEDIYYYNDKGIGLVIRAAEPNRFMPASLNARKQMYDALKFDNYSSVIEVYNGAKFMVVKYTEGNGYYTEIASDLKEGKYAIVVLECNQTMSEEVSSIVNSIKKTIRLK
ncbi:hypothetical protein [Chitinophaga varians]|uniref:hypothetical protein n=1 Tax=Chitinophaga varians TaxID=2202339 RepID=UPI00165F23B7|nr:hypothetical protein [Chitinophaga varians]MBC9908953.1 hypothetical protein [Chitinophaga varians]